MEPITKFSKQSNKPEVQPTKKSYFTPEVTVHGTVEQITEKLGAVPDGEGGSFPTLGGASADDGIVA